MKFVSAVLIASFCLSFQAFAVQPQTALAGGAAPDLKQELDNLHHAEHLHLDEIKTAPGDLLVVGTIERADVSSAVHIRSWVTDGDTGKRIKRDRQDFILMKGKVHVLDSLTSFVEKKDYDFNWEIPVEIKGFSFSQSKLNDSAFRILAVQGVGIFRLATDWTKPEEILPFYDVPTEWQSFVLSAWKFQHENAEMFDAKQVEKYREQLSKLLADDNPILAVAAVRSLSEAHDFSVGSVNGLMVRTSGLEQAALTDLVLQNYLAPAGEQFVSDIAQIIDKADSSDALKGIALGALAALRAPDFHTSVLGFKLLEALEKKQAALGIRTKSDRYISTIVTNASLPLLRQNPLYFNGEQENIH